MDEEDRWMSDRKSIPRFFRGIGARPPIRWASLWSRVDAWSKGDTDRSLPMFSLVWSGWYDPDSAGASRPMLAIVKRGGFGLFDTLYPNRLNFTEPQFRY